MQVPDTHNSGRDAEQTGDRKVLPIRLLTDREVPLRGAVSATVDDMPTAVHQWLDGEISERKARRADHDNVEFWNRVGVETGRRSRLHTPAFMTERIMAVLPAKRPSRFKLMITTFRITPVTAVVSAAGLLAAGAYAGKLFFR